jgi:hypothetical protein
MHAGTGLWHSPVSDSSRAAPGAHFHPFGLDLQTPKPAYNVVRGRWRAGRPATSANVRTGTRASPILRLSPAATWQTGPVLVDIPGGLLKRRALTGTQRAQGPITVVISVGKSISESRRRAICPLEFSRLPIGRFKLLAVVRHP